MAMSVRLLVMTHECIRVASTADLAIGEDLFRCLVEGDVHGALHPGVVLQTLHGQFCGITRLVRVEQQRPGLFLRDVLATDRQDNVVRSQPGGSGSGAPLDVVDIHPIVGAEIISCVQ